MPYAIAENALRGWWIDPASVHETEQGVKANYVASEMGVSAGLFMMKSSDIEDAWKLMVTDNYCAPDCQVVEVTLHEDHNKPVAWALKVDDVLMAQTVARTIAAAVLNSLTLVYRKQVPRNLTRDQVMALWNKEYGKIVPIRISTKEVDYVFNE